MCAQCVDPIPPHQACLIDPDKLIFDLDNPRLSLQYEVSPGASEKDFILALKKSADPSELVLSIAANGYLAIEPMVVMGKGPNYKVLEGNRRLAAIKLLRNPALAEECRIQLPEIPAHKDLGLDEVLVFRVTTEDEARAFIGFKHINGPHKWDAVAKAKYAADWFDQGNISVEEISNRIGDSFDTVRKLLYGWKVLQQAKILGVFEMEDRHPTRKFHFSHLYVALTRSQVREYLGLSPSFTQAEIKDNPIPDDKKTELGNLCNWLYGSKKDNLKPLVVSQNPDVKNLANVLADKKALSLLETERDLSLAISVLTPDDVLFMKALYKAESEAKKASAHVHTYDGTQSLYDTALNLRNIATSICTNMKFKHDDPVQED
ncbi:hypothetical protein [Oceanidesulfovibrio marinus]|uniref:ParB/Sulfiredoxin domain-containing protein n=1 Tax=Oceanidesulfovibrio marinus TaxID=370038 RepID=A0ABX6NI30_9BACT|nr:hypothetical protein [Oceanidesulfovibrio marinus]QJT10213.1 hypothetical protein E8L03_15305 [Oceanidesulfovibrio marinus]